MGSAGTGGGGVDGGGAGGGGGAAPDAMSGDGPQDQSNNCTALFNFENGALYGAAINNSYQAFTSVTNSPAAAFCGSGGMEIDATFMGSTGKSVGGEVDIAFSQTQDLSGKTLTINVRAEPPGAVSFFVILITTTSSGYQTVPAFPISLNKDQWYTVSYTFPSVGGGGTPSDGGGTSSDGGGSDARASDGGAADGGGGSDARPADASSPADAGLPDGGVPGMNAVYGLALSAFSYNADASATYKIFIDEIDLQ
jgi:hypothetical protein